MRPIERLAAAQKTPPPPRTVNGTVVSRAGNTVKVDIGGKVLDATSPAATGIGPGATVRVDIPGGAPVVSGVLGGAAMGAVPVGAKMGWDFATPPDGWLICNGAAIDAAKYPALAALYGANLPNHSGRVALGASGTYPARSTGGNASITLGVDQLPPHTHTVSNIGLGAFPVGTGATGYYPSGTDSATTSTGNGAAFSILPPYIAQYTIIFAGGAAS